MYDGKDAHLVANPLKRYLLNSTVLKSYKHGADGSLTLMPRTTTPVPRNRLTGFRHPTGPFYSVLRLYRLA